MGHGTRSTSTLGRLLAWASLEQRTARHGSEPCVPWSGMPARTVPKCCSAPRLLALAALYRAARSASFGSFHAVTSYLRFLINGALLIITTVHKHPLARNHPCTLCPLVGPLAALLAPTTAPEIRGFSRSPSCWPFVLHRIASLSLQLPSG